MHIWLLMNIGKNPFTVNAGGTLQLAFKPALAGWLFTTKKTTATIWDEQGGSKTVDLPKNTYAFNLFGTTLVVYHNPKRRNTYGTAKPAIKEISLTYPKKEKPVILSSESISGSYAQDVRNRKIERIDVFFK